MPAITRSQSNKMSINIPQDETTFFTMLKNMLPTKKKTMLPSKEKCMSQSQVDRNKSTFVSYMLKMIAKSNALQKDMKAFRIKAENDNINKSSRKFYQRSYNQTYYNNVRVITEIFYALVEWFDLVFVINGVVPTQAIQKLADAIYNRSFVLENQINYGHADKTDEEKYIVKVLLNQLEETRALFEPYVTLNMIQNRTARPKRNQAAVDYTGMDTFEPINDYDGITDIYADYTIYEDPNYNPEEDDDQDDDDEDDDDYEIEDKENETFSGAKGESFVIERVSSNHIRFVY